MKAVFSLEGFEITIEQASCNFARAVREVDLAYTSHATARRRIEEALKLVHAEVGTVERLQHCSTRTRNYLMSVLALSYDIGVMSYPEE